MAAMFVANLKQDMPPLEVARQRMSTAFQQARQQHCVAVKLIHGYGASGVGGTLRTGIRASLRKRRKKGEIAGFVFGEQWSIFEETVRELLERAPELRRDSDLDRGNEGISIAIL